MGGFPGFSTVPTDYSPNLIGAITYELFGPGTGTRTMLNKNDEALDAWSGAVGGAVTTVSFTDPNGIAQSFSITSSTTAAQIVAAIYASSTQTLTQWATVTAPSSAVIVTAKDPSVLLTMTSGGNLTWTHTTTGSLGTDIPQATLVIKNPTAPVGNSPGGYSTTIVVQPDQLTAQVETTTFSGTFAAGDQFDATVWVPALQKSIPVPTVTYATSEAATLTALAAAINTQVDLTLANGGLGISGGTLTCTTGTHTLIATADLAGFAFTVNIEVTNGAAGSAILVSKVPTTGSIGDPSTDLAAAVAGIVPHTAAITRTASNTNVWRAGHPGPVAMAAHITVYNTEGTTPTPGSSFVWAYVGTSTPGVFGFVPAASYVALPKSMFQVYSVDTAGGVKLSCNCLANL